ncbi:MAE_28990/MAE_18760 family HEPN-like nuclease [Psychrobacter sp. DAB_AL43B]|uniref:MAE_28990/MAE_18760 family HEPN-like nuclease n=1 Tax=Psychrobacter sp. DAB_AL43B TaxID=1028416 RepID=UPI0009A82FEF|nr:MAE_28990/MAE_18760 family HEPN-like nuclease [Psychrobacter sp. DAB_AL43B]SLJ84461.1 hypothetical protein DABAL43B_1265 [Psychrobacter sp. DAB_AL43B]
MQINNVHLKIAYVEFLSRLTEVKNYVNFVNSIDQNYIGDKLIIDKDDLLLDLGILSADIQYVDIDALSAKYGEENSLEENIDSLKISVESISNKLQDVNLVEVNREIQKTLRASSYLLLYNILESTMSEAINAIHETISIERVDITDLSEKIHKVVLTSFKKALSNEKVSDFSKRNADVRETIMSLGYDKKKIFSGNIDADIINEYCNKYGFEPFPYTTEENDRLLYNKSVIQEIKLKRNNLAHGNESFESCGQGMVVGSLKGKLDNVEAILLAVFNGLNNFLESKRYLRNPNT